MNRWFRKSGGSVQKAGQGQSRWRRLLGSLKRNESVEKATRVEEDEGYLTCPQCNHTQVSRQSYVCPRCHRDLRYG